MGMPMLGGLPFSPAPPAFGAGAAVPGLFMGGGPAAGGMKAPAELWLDAAANPAVCQCSLEAGEFFEVVTKDPTTLVVTGTWIFEVVKAHGADAIGRFVEVKSCGASVPLLAAQLEQAFP